MQASLSNYIEIINAQNQPASNRSRLQNCRKLTKIISLRNFLALSLAFANNYGSKSFCGYWMIFPLARISSAKSCSLIRQAKRSVPQPGRIRFISNIIRACYKITKPRTGTVTRKFIDLNILGQ